MIENIHLDPKLKKCLAAMRKGLNDLMEIRKRYRLAVVCDH